MGTLHSSNRSPGPVPPQDTSPTQNLLGQARGIAAEMRAALDEEIQSSEASPSRLIDLPHGTRVKGADPAAHIYGFRDVGARVPAGSGGALLLPTRTLPVIVRTPSDGRMLLLEVREDLGPVISEAQLDVSAVWLLRALHHQLGRLPVSFNATLALAAMGATPAPAPFPAHPLTTLLPEIAREFDEDKLAALELALHAPLGFVWGPPGTGKTTVLAALVEAHLAAGRRVLVLAPTNMAVDEAVLRVCARITRDRKLRPGEIVRYWRLARSPQQKGVDGIEYATLSPALRRGSPRVLATTLHQAYLTPELVAGYDVVVVDEAAAATLPLAFWAAGLARKMVTFVGDFRQLGPVVHSQSVQGQQWLHRDVFATAGVCDTTEEEPHRAVLCTQHRMAPPISDLVSTLFYGGRLTTADEVKRRPPLECALTEHHALAVVDTSGYACNKPAGPQGRRTTPAHAEVVNRLLYHLRETKGEDGVPPTSTLAVLAPYRAQVNLHKRGWKQSPDNDVVELGTVHALQGREADIVILDLTDARPVTLSNFLSAIRHSDEGSRLINVAMSRARRQVIVVADVAWLSAQAPRRGIVQMLLARLKADAYTIPLTHLGIRP